MTMAELFDRAAERYDRARRQLVPCFDAFYGAAIDTLPADGGRPLRVLDLGAGTGLLSALIAAAYPRAQLTLVDIAPSMLRRAAERFAGEPGRITLRVMDYAAEDLGGPYDAVVSALSIHHLDHDQKRALFRRVYAALDDGGVFVNADQALGATPVAEERYHAAWLREVRASGIAAEDLAASLERIKADRNATLAEQLAWLADAGFAEVECWYKWYRFVVYSGVKA